MSKTMRNEEQPSMALAFDQPWLKAAVKFLELVTTVMQTHVHATIDEINGKSRFKDSPGAEARANVGNLIGFQLPRLMHEALLRAPSESTRHYIHLRLQRLLDMACDIAVAMENVPAAQIIRGSKLVSGPWIAMHSRLHQAAFQELAFHLQQHSIGSGSKEKSGEQLKGNSRLVWDALEGAVKSAHFLAKEINTSAAEVRNSVLEIRKSMGAEAVITKRGCGYWRADAPPEWESVSEPKVRRRYRAR